METTKFSAQRISTVKTAYTTRRVPREDMAGLLQGPDVRPLSGDLVLARVAQLGHHTNLENTEGRRVKMFLGDEIVVCYGSRYATAQFEAEVGDDLSPCHLVAAGGIAGTVVSSHATTKRPTNIEPIGLIADAGGDVLNLRRYAHPRNLVDRPEIPVIAVVGSAMSTGKTTVVGSLIRSMTLSGMRVGAGKITGTGAGGDYWRFVDAGASPVYDFVDFGYASTSGLPPDEVTELFGAMVVTLAGSGCDAVIIEIADGLFQKETHALVNADAFRTRVSGVVFSADSSVSAIAGVKWLAASGVVPLGISGLVTRSPLMVREVKGWTDLPVLKPKAIADLDVGEILWRACVERPAGEVAQTVD